MDRTRITGISHTGMRRAILSHLREICEECSDQQIRDSLRGHREAIIDSATRWIDGDPPTFAFPTWRVRARPFDYATDLADVPVPDPLPPWALPERRQIDLYLRPAAAVVRR